MLLLEHCQFFTNQLDRFCFAESQARVMEVLARPVFKKSSSVEFENAGQNGKDAAVCF